MKFSTAPCFNPAIDESRATDPIPHSLVFGPNFVNILVPSDDNYQTNVLREWSNCLGPNKSGKMTFARVIGFEGKERYYNCPPCLTYLRFSRWFDFCIFPLFKILLGLCRGGSREAKADPTIIFDLHCSSEN